MILSLGTAVQRTALLANGLRAEATVIGEQQSRSDRMTYAPVFQLTARDGRSYTVGSDVYGQESRVHIGQRTVVLYRRNHPESARIDAFAPLWTWPLVGGVVGAAFCVVPAIVLVAWMRRRANEVDPDKREAARIAAETVSSLFKRTLGVWLVAAGGILLALGLGVIHAGQKVNDSRILAATVGVVLVNSGVQVGQWVAAGSRLSYVFGSAWGTAMAVLFGWVAIFGNAANFHGWIAAGGVAVATGGSATFARLLFSVVALLAGLVSVWAWKQAFRPR